MTEDQSVPFALGKPSDPTEPRTCKTCACLQIVKKPKVMPPGMSAQEFDALPERQDVCRLNPPIVIQTPKGRALMQMPTDEAMVCWQWREPGTLPGDKMNNKI